jgi:hypothetical protein
VVDLLRAIKMWPAVILAAKRTDRVMGRISCLILSIITINWESGNGVLRGTRWLKKCVVFLVMLKITMPNQRYNALLNVISMWAVRVNTYGIKLLTFSMRIEKKKVKRMLSFPFWLLVLSVAFSSCSIICFIDFTKDKFRDVTLKKIKSNGQHILKIRIE